MERNGQRQLLFPDPVGRSVAVDGDGWEEKKMSKVYILPPEPTHEGYVEAIKAAAAQLDRDADKIIGDLDGKRKIEVSILFDPDSIPTISVKTDYLIGREYEVRIGED